MFVAIIFLLAEHTECYLYEKSMWRFFNDKAVDAYIKLATCWINRIF